MTQPLLRIEALTFRYGPASFALQVDDLQLAPGEHAAVIGPSGSGKTTLLHLIAGILVPDAGEVHLEEVAIHTMSDRARRAHRLQRIGMVFQRFELLEYLTAEDNILLPYHLQGDRTQFKDARTRARALADAMGIPHVLRRRPRRLSQGEQQRVALCRAMIVNPGVILCDEPTGNLDPDTAGTVLDLLFDQAERSGATLLVVTHDHGLLPRFNRTLDMRDFGKRHSA